MEIILNKIAIWQPVGATVLNQRMGPRDERYQTKDSPVYLTANNSLARYVKDYEVEGVKFSLFVRTLPDMDPSLVETELDEVADQITKEYALKAAANSSFDSFSYTNYYVEEN